VLHFRFPKDASRAFPWRWKPLATFKHDDLAMVEQAVEDGGGDGGVAVEDGWPLFECFVGGQHYGAAFVAGADDLEEELGTVRPWRF
jgi:hypothetical protein